ncbi:PEGA domain-containing protein [Patescibacteria group bacterium]|nr:PEGA domain-containing protein [Patescibacteria group bacterium]MBU1921826.1 PEGA domain-containing protein [Patescibacteria group bacterium]
MTARIRFLIKILFILIFFVSAPFIISYTLGYRYNFSTRQIQKTGVLLLNSFPKDAQIFLNRKDTEKETPAVIKKLLPKEYDVEIKKTGYRTWSKKLTVQSGETTFAESIILFSESPPAPVIERAIIEASFSPDKNSVVYAVEEASWNEIWLGSPKEKKFTLIDRRETTKFINVGFAWAPGSERVYLKIQTPNGLEHLIYNISKNQLQNLDELFSKDITGFKWSTSSDYVFYAKEGKKLTSYNLLTGQRKFLLNNVEEFFVRGDKIYLLTNNQQEVIIEQFNALDLAAAPSILYRLPLGNYAFQESSYPYLLLKSDDDQILLFDMSSPFIEPILQKPAKDFAWFMADDGSKKLLYFQDFEIWVYDLTTKNNELITRFGEPIKQIAWHKNGNYVFCMFETNMSAIELDSRGGRSIFTLFPADSLINFTPDYNAKTIYFIGTLDGQVGLYQYLLVEPQ